MANGFQGPRGHINRHGGWGWWHQRGAGQPTGEEAEIRCSLAWQDKFPTCQVRVVRFYVSCLLLPPASSLLLLLSSSSSSSSLSSLSSLSSSSSSSSLLNCDPRSTVFSAGPQPRPSTPSVPCRTSTTTIHAQCSLPDLNHDHTRPVFPAGPQPRPSAPSVPSRTSTASIHANCSLPDLNREYPRQKICHIECQKICQIEC